MNNSGIVIYMQFLCAFVPNWKKQLKVRHDSMFVRLFIRTEQLGSYQKDFHEIWYLRIFKKSVEKIQILLKSDKNKVYIVWGLKYVYDKVWLKFS